MLANRCPGTLVIGLSQDGRPPIFEEVVGFLSIEREHGNEVS